MTHEEETANFLGDADPLDEDTFDDPSDHCPDCGARFDEEHDWDCSYAD